ncbi:MAG: hypothetical protein AAF724_15650 [Pseudomonadota bacterium]
MADLRQRRAWYGEHQNGNGGLELTVGDNGIWLLFYHTRDAQEQKSVCLIARGTASRDSFGRPV